MKKELCQNTHGLALQKVEEKKERERERLSTMFIYKIVSLFSISLTFVHKERICIPQYVKFPQVVGYTS